MKKPILKEEIIISELKKGNRKVFESLFRKYYPWLKTVAINYVFDSDAADDIIQNFFIHLWENADNLNIKSSVKAYFTKAVRNRCLNYLRDKKVTDSNGIMYLEAYYQNLNQEEDNEQTEEITGEIFKILDTLPDKMANVFLQKYYNGMKVDEIARENKISKNTVKTQLKRAKEKIRKSLLLIIIFLCLIF